MILGAVLAGGASSRFGADKAAACLNGRPLIAHVIDALTPWVDALVVCGRDHVDHVTLADRPGPQLGPLGGLNAALRHAATHGFARVVTLPCDTPVLPPKLLATLTAAPGAAVVRDCPVIGCWPAALAPALDAFLASGGSRSMRAWTNVAGATLLDVPAPANINRPADLRTLATSSGTAVAPEG